MIRNYFIPNTLMVISIYFVSRIPSETFWKLPRYFPHISKSSIGSLAVVERATL